MGFADQLTLGRAVAVPVVVILFAWNFPNHDYYATVVFAIAMATDYLDGWWARRSEQTSNLGRLLDPIADKILVLATLIMLVGRVLPAWMVAAIVAREFLVSGLRLAALERRCCHERARSRQGEDHFSGRGGSPGRACGGRGHLG